MRLETRIELIVLIIAVVVLGGWIGYRLTNSDSGRLHVADATDTTDSKAADENDPPIPNNISIEHITNDPDASPANQASRITRSQLTEGIAEARTLIADEKLFEARKMLTELILLAPEEGAHQTIKKELDTINRALFFSRNRSKDCIFYKVVAGDNLDKIARKYDKDYYFTRLIQQVNGIRDPRKLRVGKTLKIPQGKFSVLVQKRAYRLIVLLNGHYIREYPIGIGMVTSPTPEDRFRIATKEVNPTWYAPDGVYKYGHPKNILGTRWIGFADKGDHQGYGIHGTADPSSIGKKSSDGCIRMLKKDVEELFSMLMIDDNVAIIR